MPRVSIGMPVYNGEKYIRGALESLLAQAFVDFELIISDNASIDGTAAICLEYQSRDSRIRYYRQNENRGPAGNFAYVLNVSTADYFMWAAVDDRWHPSFVETMVQSLDFNPNVGLAFSQVSICNLATDQIKEERLVCSSRGNKLFRVLARMFRPCPSLIYGLHRSCLIKSIGCIDCDYFDVFLTIWYELNSLIWVSPDCLYFAGITGKRTPYSLNGPFVSISAYLALGFRLYSSHFRFWPAKFLSLVALFMALRMSLRANLLILQHRLSLLAWW